jgi:ATP synthase protein I
MQPTFNEQIGDKEQRKLKARKRRNHGIWFGLGMFGVVGWSIAVPVVLGTFAGIWIDLHWPGPYSWTLMLLIIGLIVGCANAWFWIQKQRKRISGELEDNDNE